MTTAMLEQPATSELELAAVMQALGDEMRLTIVRALSEQDEVACGSLGLPISKATRSHHLKVLREAGITNTRSEGTRRYITLRRDDLESRFPGLLDAILAASLSVAKRSNSRPVYSSSDGDLRKARDPGSRARMTGDGKVRVKREVAGRKGKGVTTVYDLPLRDEELKALAGKLKKRCGVGGSAKDGVIELQGDHRELVVEVLRGEGYEVVLAGG